MTTKVSKAEDKFSFKLIKHCYSKNFPIPDKEFLTELDHWAEGTHVDVFSTDEEEWDGEFKDDDYEADATQVYSEDDIIEC